MKTKISILFIALFFATSIQATTIYEVPKDKGLLSSYIQKVKQCTWRLTCYFQKDLTLGTTITVIQGSDRLTDSRAVINTNYANLNADKLENSAYYATTTHAAITSIPNLATVGTITSGTWNGTIVIVPYGGTGSSTLSSNQVLLGNGTGAVKVVSGLGSTGQLLRSNGAGNPPTWETVSVDTTIDYNWTGLHTFNATTTMATTTQASSTITTLNVGTLNVNGTTLNSSSFNKLLHSTTTDVSISSNTSEVTLFSYTIPANTLSTSNVIRLKMFFTGFAVDTTKTFTLRWKYGGSTMATAVYQNSTVSNMNTGIGFIEGEVIANNATNAQEGNINMVCSTYNGIAQPCAIGSTGTAAVDSTSAQTLTLTGQFNTSSASNAITISNGSLNVER